MTLDKSPTSLSLCVLTCVRGVERVGARLEGGHLDIAALRLVGI